MEKRRRKGEEKAKKLFCKKKKKKGDRRERIEEKRGRGEPIVFALRNYKREGK